MAIISQLCIYSEGPPPSKPFGLQAPCDVGRAPLWGPGGVDGRAWLGPGCRVLHLGISDAAIPLGLVSPSPHSVRWKLLTSFPRRGNQD